MHDILCYSQRLLNPFRGVMNCIRYQSAEAITTDGVNWDIYVSNDALLEDLEIIGHAQTNDVRYGSWSAEKGLRRGPIIPSEDFHRLETMGHIVYEYLLGVHDALPFPFEDNYELWLLDSSLQPLALLNSAVSDKDMTARQVVDWRAGLVCKECFASESLNQLHDIVRDNETAGEYLTRYINDCASDQCSAQWFMRTESGTGVGLDGINLDEDFVGRELDHADFPQYILNNKNHDRHHQKLIDDFHDWQAPWLLLLTTLDQSTRASFEQKAKNQAMIVDAQYRLYPAIVDEVAIKTARVEAMLRKNDPVKADHEEVMSTFYIELHPCPYE